MPRGCVQSRPFSPPLGARVWQRRRLADVLLVCAESNPPSVLATFRFAAHLSLVQVLQLCLAFLRAGRLLSFRSWEPQGLPSQCPMLDHFLLRCQPSPTIHLRIAPLYGGRSFLCRGSVRASAHTVCPAHGPIICVSLDLFGGGGDGCRRCRRCYGSHAVPQSPAPRPDGCSGQHVTLRAFFPSETAFRYSSSMRPWRPGP